MATIGTTPFEGQQAGTSGLRKRVTIFSQPNYLENYVQSVFDCLPKHHNNTLVIGGDGRFFNEHALPIVLRMAAANQIAKAIVGQHGWLSTPAASQLVRKNQARAAIILTASHNPGGRSGDFGIKLNLSNGGAADEQLTGNIYNRTREIREFAISDDAVPPLDRIGNFTLESMRVEVVDPVAEYAALMQSPYVHELFVKQLGFPESAILGTPPLPDFGGGYPDPNPTHATRLHHAMMRTYAPDFGAALDSDADRHMVMGRGIYVTPSDSLALLAEYMHLAPGYSRGLKGVARSIATSSAVDRVARATGVAVYETPTGWKYFCNLLDSRQVNLCGEESAGAGSDHIREKDGIWAILLWLNILARSNRSLPDLLLQHWQRFGRTYYERRDYEEIEEADALKIYSRLSERLPQIAGRSSPVGDVREATEFNYEDPVTGAISLHQGIKLRFDNGARLVMRISGTGTTGRTLRIYGERHDPRQFDRMSVDVLEPLMVWFDQIAGISTISKRLSPSVVS
jgi:phosphoglucomutase